MHIYIYIYIYIHTYIMNRQPPAVEAIKMLNALPIAIGGILLIAHNSNCECGFILEYEYAQYDIIYKVNK